MCNVCGVCQCSFDHSTNQCNLGAPALPASYNNQCFAQNRCQQNVEATVGCDGNCVLTIPENPIPAANGFYRVEHNESIYLYNAGFEDVCYLFTNNNLTGDAVFVPANSQQEYLNFIGADLITVPGTGFGLEDVTSQPGIYNSDGTPF